MSSLDYYCTTRRKMLEFPKEKLTPAILLLLIAMSSVMSETESPSDSSVKNPKTCFDSCAKEKLKEDITVVYAKMITFSTDLCTSGIREFTQCLKGCYDERPARQMKRNIDYLCNTKKDYEKIPNCFASSANSLKGECYFYSSELKKIKETGRFDTPSQCEDVDCDSSSGKCSWLIAIFDCPGNHLRAECGVDSRAFDYHMAIISFLSNADSYQKNERKAPEECDRLTRMTNTRFLQEKDDLSTISPSSSPDEDENFSPSTEANISLVLMALFIIWKICNLQSHFLMGVLSMGAVIFFGCVNVQAATEHSVLTTMTVDTTDHPVECVGDLKQNEPCEPDECMEAKEKIPKTQWPNSNTEPHVLDTFCTDLKAVKDCEIVTCCNNYTEPSEISVLCKDHWPSTVMTTSTTAKYVPNKELPPSLDHPKNCTVVYNSTCEHANKQCNDKKQQTSNVNDINTKSDPKVLEKFCADYKAFEQCEWAICCRKINVPHDITKTCEGRWPSGNTEDTTDGHGSRNLCIVFKPIIFVVLFLFFI